MIKLIVNPRTQPTTYNFEKATIVIGASKGVEADLALPQEKLEPAHIKIMEQGNRFIAINLANDPFVTINGVPFGKKVIHTNDILEIGSTEISFEGTATLSTKEKDGGIADTAFALPALLDKVITHKEQEVASATKNIHHNPQFESTIKQQNSKDEEEEFDLESEMRELDAWLHETSHSPYAEAEEEEGAAPPLDTELFAEDDLYEEELVKEPAAAAPVTPHQQPAPRAEELANAKPVHKQTIKDLYFKDFEEDEHQPDAAGPTGASTNQASTAMDWHTIWIIVVGVVSTIVIVALLLYANASGKSEDEELKAAEALSDVAMALAYAQLNNIVPQNQNWSDPEFLKNNLTAVLSTDYPVLAQFDSHGQFSNSPYLLRIYTSSDLSNFLIIAQPAPSLLQWLIPKSTILVYSTDMELRKTTDLKSLNRILVNPSLDGSVANDVRISVSKADIIPLAALSKRQHRLGFSPPKALALIRPGAENRIYNAPRYYNFGEAIMRKAVILAENQENNNEILLLKHEIDVLTKYPNFVMYSSQGMQAAMQAQKALALFEPDAKFLIAYLQYNSQGLVHNSHLLIDDGSGDVALREERVYRSTKASTTQAPSQSLGSMAGETLEASQTDIAHPLFFQLSALSASRQQALKPISEEIISLLETENHYAIPGFREKFEGLTLRYLRTTEEQQNRIAKGLTKLYHDYPAMPLSDFMHYVKSTGMDTLAKETLKEQIEKQAHKLVSQETISDQIAKIKGSRGLKELEEEISRANKLFTLENIPDAEKVMTLQNSVRTETLEKVDSFILSPNSQLEADAFTEENRYRLVRILKAAWVRDQEEVDYYINEFDILMKRQPPVAAKEPASEEVTASLPPVEKAPEISLKEHNRFWQQGRIWKKPQQ